MKKVTDLKENECIHCPTKEEFKAILELNSMNDIRLDRWNLNKKNTVYYPFRHSRTGGFDGLEYANKERHTIHPASDFLEPTYQLTKTQIIEISENGSLVKELFPECFEVELEVGKWYKGKTANMLVHKINEEGGYGFYNNDWNIFLCCSNSREWTQATEEEVTEALKSHYEKEFGIKYEEYKLENNTLKGKHKCWVLWNDLFKDGVFETPSEVIKVIETYGKDKLITLIEEYERNSK